MLNWIEVDAAALGNNVAEFRRRLGPEVKLGAVVKSNAYGHGMLEVSSVVRDRVDWLCVNNLDEAVRLHDADARRPILIMGYVARNDLEEIVLRELRPVVYNRETAEKLEEIASRHHRRVFLHLKVETGTNRQGVVEEEVPDLVGYIRRSQWLELEGLTTHFANIEDTTDHTFAEAQWAAYHRVERSFGAFERSFSIPESVDAKKIEARFVNGEMTVTLPKRAESKPRSVKVKIATA